MAAYFSRVSYHIFRIQKCHQKQLLVLAVPASQANISHWCNRQEKFRWKARRSNLLTCAAIISACGFLFYNLKDKYGQYLPSLGNKVYAASIDKPNNNSYREKFNFIADVVEVSAASVVHIEIKDHGIFDLFTGKSPVLNSGSGFIVGSDGLILTNAHVVFKRPNTSVLVRLSNGDTYPGIVENVDVMGDLATVRINAKNLPTMKLGTSADLRPGEFVVAIGSPLTLNNTITSGVISNIGRLSQELGIHKSNMKYIQTDAAITFGNSGGPLVNLNGEAIAINAMKVASGISFAIPIDYAKEFLKLIKENKAKGVKTQKKDSKRRYLGITMITLTPNMLYELQNRVGGIPFDIKHGVFVWKVVARSPAAARGLLPGDIITHINGRPIVSVDDVYAELENPKSTTLNLSILRNKDRLELSVVPEDD